MAVPSNIYPSANKIIPRIYSGGCGNAFNRTFFNPMRGWTSTQTIGRDIGHFLNGHRGYTRQICMNNYSNPFNFGFGVCGGNSFAFGHNYGFNSPYSMFPDSSLCGINSYFQSMLYGGGFCC